MNSASAPATLSVLDLAPVSQGSTTAAALRNSIELAKTTERLGYRRFWVAEHHNMPGIASSSPAVLIGQLAAATSTLRVGSGGVMLPNHPPLVVAEQFGMLTALYPDRVDLGIGRAPGTDPRTAAALRRTANPLSADDFPQQLGELVNYFIEDPAEAGNGGLHAIPAAGNQPTIWLLGSSDYSARLAGLLGLPFAFAHHFSAHNTLPAARAYRDNFSPSAALDRPYLMIAANVLAAEDDDRANFLSLPGALSFVRLRQGKPGLFPSPEEAAAYPYSELERLIVADRLGSQIIGGPATVKKGVAELVAATGADELMVTTMTHDPADRLRSYELLAGLWTTADPAAAGESEPGEQAGVTPARR